MIEVKVTCDGCGRKALSRRVDGDIWNQDTALGKGLGFQQLCPDCVQNLYGEELQSQLRREVGKFLTQKRIEGEEK